MNLINNDSQENEPKEISFEQFQKLLELDNTETNKVHKFYLSDNLYMSFTTPSSFFKFRDQDKEIRNWTEEWFKKWENFCKDEESTGNPKIDEVFTKLYERFPEPDTITDEDFYVCGIVKFTNKSFKLGDMDTIKLMLTSQTFLALVQFIKPLYFGSELSGVVKDIEEAGK